MNIKNYSILVDDGVRGKSLKRPKMSKVVSWIKEEEVETFIVNELIKLTISREQLCLVIYTMLSNEDLLESCKFKFFGNEIYGF